MKTKFAILSALFGTLLAYSMFCYDSSLGSDAEALDLGLACAASNEGALATLGIQTERARGELLIINVASGSISEGMGLEAGDQLLLISSRGVDSVANADSLYVQGERTDILFQRTGTTHVAEVPGFNCPVISEPRVVTDGRPALRTSLITRAIERHGR